uniref:Deoxyribonuclease II n=1 Tax=Trichuris muris TaxID=70415 RepID=A0A5S6Q0B9_TRIMR
MKLSLLVVSLASLLPFTQTVVQYSCRGQRPDDRLDWFILYKLPKRSEEGLYNGKGYVFVDSTKVNPFWTPSRINIDQKDQMLHTTLNIYYGASEEDKQSSLVLFYSDMPPYFRIKIEKQNGKGIILAQGGRSSLWIVHSIPLFPDRLQYKWPSMAENDAQMAVCLSIATQNVDQLAGQLVFQDPVIFFHNVPEAWRTEKKLGVLLRERRRAKAPFFKKLSSVSTLGGTKLLVISRMATGESDFYADELAPQRAVPLRCAERHQVENLLDQIDLHVPKEMVHWNDYASSIDCSKEKSPLTVQLCPIFQIIASEKSTCPRPDFRWQLMRFIFAERLKIYNENEGASWALSNNDKGYWCFTDFHRKTSQLEESGGAVCMLNKSVYNLFKLATLKTEVKRCR